MLTYLPTVQCISEAFGVSPSDEVQRQKLSIKPATLQSVFESYLREKVVTPEVITFTHRIKGMSVEFFGSPSERLRRPRRPQLGHRRIALPLVRQTSRKRSN